MKMPCDVCKTSGYHVEKFEYEWRSREDRIVFNLCLPCCSKVRRAKVPPHIPHKQVIRYVKEKASGKQ